MPKPILSINHKELAHNYGTLGMTELLTFLRDSGLFDIEGHEERITPLRGERATILYYNGKKIYLDLWEYSAPTYTTKAYDANFDLIIKLQHRVMSLETFEKKFQHKKVLLNLTPEERMDYVKKIVPWTFFASRIIKPFIGKEIEELPEERIAFFCGKMWRSRKGMVKKLENEIEIVKSDQGFRRKRPIKDVDYLQRMRTSKYGLVLAGRSSNFTEGKNRREIDYMILKKPLLLNYQPFYYNPLENGKHFIYIDGKIDLKELDKLYNIEQIVENASQWYEDNASPMDAAKTFLQIMKDRFEG